MAFLSDAELQVWAPGSDATEIRRIFNGVKALVEQESGRSFLSPAAGVEWDFSVPAPQRSGLSNQGTGELPQLYLPEPPNTTLTGTVTVAANGTVITGSGSAFDTELAGYVSGKTAVEILAERLLIDTVDSATQITLKTTTPHVAGASGEAIKADVIWLKTRTPGTFSWTDADCRYVEIRGRVLSYGGGYLPIGDGSVRARVNFGYAEDAGPAAAMLLMGEMVQEWNTRQGGKGSITRVAKSGTSVTWSSMGARAKEYMERAKSLRYPMRFAA